MHSVCYQLPLIISETQILRAVQMREREGDEKWIPILFPNRSLGHLPRPIKQWEQFVIPP